MNIQSLSKEQLLRLLSCAKKRRERDWLMILTAYSHALRAAEVAAITPDAIADGYLKVVRLKGSMRTCQPLVRHADPLLNLADPLIEYVALQPWNQPIFKVSTVQFWRLMQRYGAEAGLPKHLCHPHVLKHSCCTHLIAKESINVVQAWAGHKSMGSTGVYTGLQSEEVFRRVQEAFSL